MSEAPRDARSFEAIADADLRRLADIAAGALAHVCRPGNKSRAFAGRLRLLCLCQGAALHLRQCRAGVPMEGRRGVHDFDVWGFFAALPGHRFVSRRPWARDFGPSRFGRSPGDHDRAGRKVDVLGRAVEIRDGEAAADAVLRWLHRPGGSPAALRRRPVFVISPGPEFGRMIWAGEPDPPPERPSSRR